MKPKYNEADLLKAINALAFLVRTEFGDDKSLSEIAFIWGDSKDKLGVEALRRLEAIEGLLKEYAVAEL